MGYSKAGFEVVGVDSKPQPRYPFEFVQADALEYPLEGFDVIHASPPCQHYSALNNGRWGNATGHPDMVAAVRERLRGHIYVIENVPRSPLLFPITLCGSMFGLGVDGFGLRRHRLFESPVELAAPRPCDHSLPCLGVYGHSRGGGPLKGRTANADQARAILGTPWMSRDGCSQAIPPAYTEYIGRQLLEVVRRD
jgi:DNA (cytosine-5)-methyltransferase 1